MSHRAVGRAALRLAVLAVAATLATTASGARRPAHGGTFRMPTDSPIHSLDPVAVQWPAEALLASVLYDSPYRLHGDGRARPHILYPVQALGGGRTLRFKVHPHAVFHDGRPVRASHVVASLQRVAKSSRTSWILAMLEGVPAGSRDAEGIALIGSSTVQLQLRSGRALDLLVHALSTVQTGVIPSSRRPGKGIGTGPFALRSARGGDRVLRGNRDYFDGPPFLSEVRVLGPASRDDHIRRFQLGRADGSLLGDSVYGEAPPIKGVAVTEGPPTRLVYLIFNTSKGPAAELPLRRAVDLALDRRRLAGSTARPLGWPGGKSPTRPDPARAKTIAAGLGLSSESRPLVLLVDGADAFGVALAPLVQRDLRAAGIPVAPLIASAGDARGRLRAGSWDLRLQTVSPVSVDEVLALAQTLALGGMTRDAARLVQRAPEARESELARGAAALTGQIPLIPLCGYRPRMHHRARFRGLRYDLLGRLGLADIWMRPGPGAAGGR